MSLARRKVLVTGGTGFLGSQLVRALVEAGARVRVLDNDFRGSRSRLEGVLDDVELITGDIRDRDTVFGAVEGMETVCHLAAINGTRHFYEIPDQVLSVGILGTLWTLEAAREHGVADYFYASSSEVYQTPPTVPTAEDVPMMIPNPQNPRYSYGGSKLIGEILTFNFGRGRFARTVAFRPHNVYGANMGNEHVIPEFAARLRGLTRDLVPGTPVDFPIQGSGAATRAFCHVDDFTRGLMAVVELGQDGLVYHIGTDEEVTIADLARACGEVLGHPVNLVTGPQPEGGTPRRCPDIARLRGLGYEPQIPLREGLGDVVRWYAERADETRPV